MTWWDLPKLKDFITHEIVWWIDKSYINIFHFFNLLPLNILVNIKTHRILFYTYITRSLFEHEHFDFHPPPLYVACQLIALSLVLFGVYGLLTYRQLERIMTSIGDLAAIFLLKLSIWGREHLLAASCWLCTQRMLFSYTARPKCWLVYYDTITQEIKNTYTCFLSVQPFWCCKTRGLGSHCSLT